MFIYLFIFFNSENQREFQRRRRLTKRSPHRSKRSLLMKGKLLVTLLFFRFEGQHDERSDLKDFQCVREWLGVLVRDEVDSFGYQFNVHDHIHGIHSYCEYC